MPARCSATSDPRPGAGASSSSSTSEYLGEDDPAADVEVIEMGYRYLVDVGLEDIEVKLNSIGSPESRPGYRAALTRYLNERRDVLSEDSLQRIDSNPMRVLDSKVDAPKLPDAPAPLDYLDEESGSHFEAVKAGLDALGVPYMLEPRLVRGLDYYTRTVFEYVPKGYEAAHNSVGGGGRYDALSEVLGGPPLPALGFALGLDRILLARGEGAVGPRAGCVHRRHHCRAQWRGNQAGKPVALGRAPGRSRRQPPIGQGSVQESRPARRRDGARRR